jgi:Transposase DDE domain
LKTDFGGLPIAFHLTGGEASDSRNFETLLDIGPDINPRAALGDKGYDSKSNRQAARQRGICPAIPYRSNTKDVPAFFPKILYKGRARIEQSVGKLKRFKRIALRCEKTARNYSSFVALALGFILIKSVHTARTPASSTVRQITIKWDARPCGATRIACVRHPPAQAAYRALDSADPAHRGRPRRQSRPAQTARSAGRK